MPQLYTNDATSALLAGITDIATSLSVVVADAAKYPIPVSPDFFDITLKEGANIEVMRITTRVAEVMTIASRAREGTTAKAFTTAASVTLGITAANASTVTLHVGLATGAHAATAISNTPAGSIAATTVQAAIDELNTEKVGRTGTFSSAEVPTGSTAQRDASPLAGYFRFNTTNIQFEGYTGTGWSGVGGASGGGGNPIVYENDITVTANYTLTTGKNASSTGPLTINSGVVVTVPTGSRWVIL